MTKFEYTYLWWEGSTTSTMDGRLRETTPPIGEEVIDKINSLASDGWEVDKVTAAPLTTGWISPGGRVGCRRHHVAKSEVVGDRLVSRGVA